MRRVILAAVVCCCFLVFASDAAAQCGERRGPVRQFVANAREAKPVRTAIFGPRVQAQPCSPAPAVQSGPVIYTIGGVRTGNCPGGVCPIPQAVPGQALPVAVPGK